MPSVPTHIGYILDGNRRWAKKHGLPTYEGHLAGYNALHDVIDATVEAGVEYISFYTFSTKNWQRTETEVKGIMSLVRRLLKNDVEQFIKKGYKILVLGERTMIPADIVQAIDDAEGNSAGGTRATLAICFSYGGQEEIVRAAQRLIEQGVAASEVTLESFAEALDQPSVPPCDLIVRTSGEQRLSDFMLWRSAYSEFIFLDKLWPEMTKEDVASILETYDARERRFGG
ncbi:MAG: polyprenyl diphosphate synthase [Candidatus Saccharimonas sp.]